MAILMDMLASYIFMSNYGGPEIRTTFDGMQFFFSNWFTQNQYQTANNMKFNLLLTLYGPRHIFNHTLTVWLVDSSLMENDCMTNVSRIVVLWNVASYALARAPAKYQFRLRHLAEKNVRELERVWQFKQSAVNNKRVKNLIKKLNQWFRFTESVSFFLFSV